MVDGWGAKDTFIACGYGMAFCCASSLFLCQLTKANPRGSHAFLRVFDGAICIEQQQIKKIEFAKGKCASIAQWP
jgi:hypothetical protein